MAGITPIFMQEANNYASKINVGLMTINDLSHIIGYSPGDRPLAGFGTSTSGGECLLGFRMALEVASLTVMRSVFVGIHFRCMMVSIIVLCVRFNLLQKPLFVAHISHASIADGEQNEMMFAPLL